jgi:hypothetical protein
VALAALAAAVLSVEGVDLVVVGSTALSLHGLPFTPPDADIVPAPDRDNLDHLRLALISMGVDPHRAPSVAALTGADVVRLETGLGPVDLLCARGREDYRRLYGRAATVRAWDAEVLVGCIDDVLDLRRRFKEPTPVG